MMGIDFIRNHFIFTTFSIDSIYILCYLSSGIEKHLEKEKTKPVYDLPALSLTKTIKGTRGDIDDEDDEESYYR